MFELYLKDSAIFLDLANQSLEARQSEEACRYFRASVFFAYSALEAFVFYLGNSFSQANNIEPMEIAYLNDKRVYFDPSVGVRERTEYHTLEDKIRILLRRFSPESSVGKSEWEKLQNFKKFRDSLVHPKQIDDLTSVDEYLSKATDGLQAVIDIMNSLSIKIFNKAMRQKLLDLRPD